MLFVAALGLGCAHTMTAWDVLPPAAVDLPDAPVAVIADARECKRIADELVDTLASRPGIAVEPRGTTRLVVRNCRTDVRTDVDVQLLGTFDAVESPTTSERRRVTLNGEATAELVVDVAGSSTTVLEGAAHLVARSGWQSGDDGGLRRGLGMQSDLARDVAWDLGQQIAPLPETIRRRMYKDPEPGTARALHNQAVEAERAGDLRKAIDLAKEAYAAHPTPYAMATVESLEDRAAGMGYAVNVP